MTSSTFFHFFFFLTYVFNIDIKKSIEITYTEIFFSLGANNDFWSPTNTINHIKVFDKEIQKTQLVGLKWKPIFLIGWKTVIFLNPEWIKITWLSQQVYYTNSI